MLRKQDRERLVEESSEIGASTHRTVEKLAVEGSKGVYEGSHKIALVETALIWHRRSSMPKLAVPVNIVAKQFVTIRSG